MPGFVAEATLYQRTGYYGMVWNANSLDGIVYQSGCYTICSEICVGTGEERHCWEDCNVVCGGDRGGPIGHRIS